MAEVRGLPYDAELESALPAIKAAQAASMVAKSPAELVNGRGVEVLERTVPGPEGAPDLLIAVFRPTVAVSDAPVLYYIHGGGMVGGDRYTGGFAIVEWVERFGIVCVTPEYRLAPQHPHPALVDDCYAGLLWTHDHVGEFGGDPNRIVVGGSSAGGGLAAAVALLARDRNGPSLTAQFLGCPMLDDRNESVSCYQFDGLDGLFDRTSNLACWEMFLGEPPGGPSVSPYAAPARATDLSGLPSAYIDAGSCEPFRDEAVDYASRLWAAGVQAELHVWAGGFHGFHIATDTRIAQGAAATQLNWFSRIFGSP